MTDIGLLVMLVCDGIDKGTIKFTTHERDIFDGVHRRYYEGDDDA